MLRKRSEPAGKRPYPCFFLPCNPRYPGPARGDRSAGGNQGSESSQSSPWCRSSRCISRSAVGRSPRSWRDRLTRCGTVSPDRSERSQPLPAVRGGNLPWQAGLAAGEPGPIPAYMLIARQEWENVRHLGAAALPPLWDLLRDDDPKTRATIISIIGQIGDRHAQAACQKALRDRDPYVRWKAVLASMNCGLASHDLPLMVAGRERTGPDPAAAALLNFLFLGIGYNYLGKWWGFPVFMTYMSSSCPCPTCHGSVPSLPYRLPAHSALWYPYVLPCRTDV